VPGRRRARRVRRAEQSAAVSVDAETEVETRTGERVDRVLLRLAETAGVVDPGQLPGRITERIDVGEDAAGVVGGDAQRRRRAGERLGEVATRAGVIDERRRIGAGRLA
jgi:hypothetical protein